LFDAVLSRFSPRSCRLCDPARANVKELIENQANRHFLT
jgi:hypothetical protein